MSTGTALFLVLIFAMAAVGGWFGSDMYETRRLWLRFKGDTREETMKKIRAEVRAMRQEYSTKPGDRFSVEILEMCDRLEETMQRVEAEA